MPTLRRSRKSKKKKQREEEKKLEQSPHPYHPASYPVINDVPIPPPGMMHNFDNGMHRILSESSRVSDITMDSPEYHHQALKVTAAASAASALDEKSAVLEYSDTSDDLRGEDRYFSLPYSDSSASLLSPSSAIRDGSAGSAFQTLRHVSREEAHKVVRYRSNSSDFPFDDKSDGSPEDPPVLPTSSHHQVQSEESPQGQNWVTNLAYAFRTPRSSESEKVPDMNEGKRVHRKQRSSTTMEFPQTDFAFSEQEQRLNGNETTPLLKDIRRKNNGLYGSDESGRPPPPPPSNDLNGKDDRNYTKQFKRAKSRKMGAFIAACYLMDYENGRPPSLSSNFETVTPEQLRLFRIQFSEVWRWLGVNLAVVLLFMAHAVNDISSVAMHTYAVTILLVEVYMKEVLYGDDHSRDFGHRDRALVRPMMLLLVFLGIESWTRLVLPEYGMAVTSTPQRPFILVTAVFKPLVLFYTSRKARNALEALQRIGKIVTRVLLIEVFLILSFAAVACRMFKHSSGFETLAASWLSLFERKQQWNRCS